MEHPASHSVMLTWLAPVALAMMPGCSQAEAMNVDELERRLAADLPAGSSPQDVAEYVSRNDLSSDGVNVDQLRPMRERPGHSDLLAMKRDVRTSGLVKTSLQMQFVFDDDNRLIETNVREVHTGP